MTKIYNEVLERKKATAEAAAKEAAAVAEAAKEAVMPIISDTYESATPSKL